MIPHPHTSDIQAVNLITWGAYQFATWLGLGGELYVGRIARGSQRWGINHQQVQISGTPATALALPQTRDDDHLFPSIGVDGLGRLHVWANMHLDVMQAIKTTAAHSTDGWLSMAGWADGSADYPSADVRNTYPMPIHYPDGTLQFWNRTGVVQSTSGKSDFHFWNRGPAATSWSARTTMFQGLSVPEAGGSGVPGADATSGVDDPTNWSAYFTVPLVESPRGPHPGRLHVCWVWRAGGLIEDTNFMAAYGYSDDKGVTWYTIDGTLLTVPITPLNSVGARFPGSAFVGSIARSGGVVVAALDSADHGIVAGDSVRVFVADTTYNGTFTVASVGNPTASSIAWGQAVADDVAGGTGSISKYAADVNWGGLTVDELGLPHCLVSSGTVRYVRRNSTNNAWLQSNLANPLGGVVHIGRKNAFWLRGHLWALTTTQPNAQRRQRLIRITGSGNPSVMLSGDIGASGWEPSADPEAYRRFGTVETLACDGNTPRVFVYPAGARIAA